MSALLLIAQVAAWSVSPSGATVGDTVRLARTLRVEAGTDVQVLPLTPEDAVVPLADPLVRRGEHAVEIVYLVAPFRTGEWWVTLPDITVLDPDGGASTVAGDSAMLRVSSLLPAGDTIPPPHPSLGPLARPARSPAPLVGLVLAASAAVGGWGIARRRTRPRPARRWLSPATQPPLERWAAAGERRAVATSAAHELRVAIAASVPAAGRHLALEPCLEVLERECPQWPLRDLAKTLRALERARFAPTVPGDVVVLADEARSLASAVPTWHRTEPA